MKISGCSVKIIGLENLDVNNGQLLVSNHQSGFDIYSINAYIPLQVRWLAKESLFRIPFMGWAMSAARYIPIDRDNARKAIKSLRSAAESVKRGNSVVIFPEGTRTPDGQLKEFKKGTLYMAKKYQLTMTPVTIKGTYNIMRKKSLRIHPQAIKIIIDKPIPFSEIEGRKEEIILDEIRNIIKNNLESGDNEI